MEKAAQIKNPIALFSNIASIKSNYWIFIKYTVSRFHTATKYKSYREIKGWWSRCTDNCFIISLLCPNHELPRDSLQTLCTEWFEMNSWAITSLILIPLSTLLLCFFLSIFLQFFCSHMQSLVNFMWKKSHSRKCSVSEFDLPSSTESFHTVFIFFLPLYRMWWERRRLSYCNLSQFGVCVRVCFVCEAQVVHTLPQQGNGELLHPCRFPRPVSQVNPPPKPPPTPPLSLLSLWSYVNHGI